MAVCDLAAGESVEIDGRRVVTRAPIACGHKVALRDIAAGESVRKYGWPIGRALRAIAAGEHVHTANLGTRLEGLSEYVYRGGANAWGVAPAAVSAGDAAETRGAGGASSEPSTVAAAVRRAAADGPAAAISTASTAVAAAHVSSTAAATHAAAAHASGSAAHAPWPSTFMGYRRKNGRVGTRNEIWILCTVGCVARTAERIAGIGTARFDGRIDGVHAFTHPFGCSQLGDDLSRTRRILASLALHPNAGGVLIIGLGCESNQLDKLLAEAADLDTTRVRAFSAQAADDEVEQGIRALEELVAIAERDKREPCPLSELKVGLKCGGSDGFSGITANPLVGYVADCVAAAGGTPILTEIPEIFGAEHLLMERAANEQVFRDIVAVVNDFKRYFLDNGQPIYENPSPGNIAGGITTLEEKSLGAVQKGGHAPVGEVLRYGERASRPGLALLEAPGNDAVSSTALVAAGATILLFTTGRGTPLGFPAPTLKIASSSALALKKPHWIDFDAGNVLGGARSLREAGDELMRLVIDTASGKRARNEQNGQREISIWKGGVTL
ncbi:MAG TPA: altronate dehydratase family protein [Steroidobacteraceae bacterium]|nr:altronate dehydratase family protein [Steroidobacteraceae bacterium]